MAIIYQKNAKTGTLYAYERVTEVDPETGSSRSRRKLIGKVNPESGEIVPTGKVGRPRKQPAPQDDSCSAALKEELERAKAQIAELTRREKEKDAEIARLREENAYLAKENERREKMLDDIHRIVFDEP